MTIFWDDGTITTTHVSKCCGADIDKTQENWICRSCGDKDCSPITNGVWDEEHKKIDESQKLIGE